MRFVHSAPFLFLLASSLSKCAIVLSEANCAKTAAVCPPFPLSIPAPAAAAAVAAAQKQGQEEQKEDEEREEELKKGFEEKEGDAGGKAEEEVQEER